MMVSWLGDHVNKQEKHADFSPIYRPIFKGNLPISQQIVDQRF